MESGRTRADGRAGGSTRTRLVLVHQRVQGSPERGEVHPRRPGASML